MGKKEIYYCDRCNTEVKRSYELSTIEYTLHKDWMAHHKEYQLCQKCIKQLDNFIRNKSKNEEEDV